MCGVQDLSLKLRQIRLRWLGHVKRAEGIIWGGESWGVRIEGESWGGESQQEG